VTVRRSPTPAPIQDDHLAPAGPARGGGWGPPLLVVAAAALAFLYLSRGLGVAVTSRGAVAGLVVAAAVTGSATRPGRWVLRRPLRGWRRRLAAGVAAGGGLAAWVVGLAPTTAVAVSLIVPLGLATGRVRSSGKRKELVKPDMVERTPLEIRWLSAARQAGLVDPAGRGGLVPIPLAGPPEPNGVGGQVLRLKLPLGVTPEDVASVLPVLRAWTHYPYLYTRTVGDVGMEQVEIHLYDRYPLTAAPIMWTELAGHARGGVGRIPFALDVFGNPVTFDGRLSSLWIAETGAGKTAGQLAQLAGLAASRIPVEIRIGDNRSGGDHELRQLKPVAAGYGRTNADLWWQVRLCTVEVSRRRDAGLSADNAVFVPSAEWPLVHLVITELLTFCNSRPPTSPPHGLGWPEYTGGVHDRRPGVQEWRGMVADGLGVIGREGRTVGVGWSGCAQAAQLDSLPAAVRRYVTQRYLGRVISDDDVDPALGGGALRSGARAHQLPDHPGLFYPRPSGAAARLARTVWVPGHDIEPAIARPLRRSALAYQTPGGEPATRTP
jgi:hypothetical protein